MKHFMPIMLASCILHVTVGATDIDTSSPSQNTQLNAITPSGKIDPEKKGFLQRAYEEEDETAPPSDTEPESAAEPESSPVNTTDPEKVDGNTAPLMDTNATAKVTTAGESEEKTEEEADSKSDFRKWFTLQYYYDKWDRYLDEKEKRRTKPLHSDKLNEMPVIGK
ncbi:hypothetical protein WCX72_02700 [Sulfurimonas sp. HSL1-6]|uniref:hypothetical protein n=1 Tax=Thiomicrolovo immobilis TaxID=3131935 RepID=UPI0031F87595